MSPFQKSLLYSLEANKHASPALEGEQSFYYLLAFLVVIAIFAAPYYKRHVKEKARKARVDAARQRDSAESGKRKARVRSKMGE